jgi:hypothetical protein
LVQHNRGLKLLKLLGYREGTGLGSAKDGQLAPVAFELDQQRQGLGYLEDLR